jgi:hypothetical protein
MKKYKRQGKNVILDLVRDIFVIESKEENVRQNILSDLMNNWKIPKEYLRVEENMSHHKKGIKDRADIVILHPEKYIPWILFEIKAPHVPICDDTLFQAHKYNSILTCTYLCLTNGNHENWYIVINEETKQIEKPKTIEDLLDHKYSFVQFEPYYRPNLVECHDQKTISAYINDYAIIGEDTPSKFHSFIINFYGFLHEDTFHVSEQTECPGFTIIEDGIRNTVFGNAGGGIYDGYYRYYIVQFPNGDHNIVSLSLFGTMKTVNDPHWGNRNSITSLIVAIDDFENKHNSLELNIDKNLFQEGDKWILKHDGRLTVGKKGAAKINDVISFCKMHIPDLIINDQIILGELKNNELLSWQNSQHVVINLIRYALVRDQYRKSVQ